MMENMSVVSCGGFRVFFTFSLFHEILLKRISDQAKTNHNPPHA
jgi:hypothetical protein